MMSDSEPDEPQPHIRKKSRRSKPVNETKVVESALIAYLIERFLWGAYSPQEVQRIASFLQTDLAAAINAGPGVTFPQVDLVEKIGNHGRIPSNMHRDLMRTLVDIGISALSVVNLSLKETGTVIATIGTQCIIYPHELFSSMYTHYHDAFMRRFVVSQATIKQFWEAVSHTTQYKEHPVRLRKNHKSRCIPLVLHTDGVPVSGIGKAWSKLVDLYSWGSLLNSDGVTWLSLYLIIGIHCVLCSDATIDEIWTIIVWSFGCMYRGTWPDRHWNGRKYPAGTPEYIRAGTELAGGFYTTLWVIAADLDQIAKNLKLRHYAASQPCTWCNADTTGIPWSDFKPDALWMETVFSPSQFVATIAPANRLFSLPGVTVETLWPDYMHCKYLGVDQYFLGSVLVVITFLATHAAAGSWDERLARVWALCLEHYKENPVDATTRFRNMRVGMFTQASRW